MSGNTFGHSFCVTSFGESHGPAIGCVVDGCPPGLELAEADIQADLDRRKPGTSRHVTQRQEPDQVEILSGLDLERAAAVLEEMSPDDATDLISELEPHLAALLLQRM